MEAPLQAWVGHHSVWHSICDTWLKYALVDLGGSLAVASRGLFATGVSTDLNGKVYKIGIPPNFSVSNKTLSSHILELRWQSW